MVLVLAAFLVIRIAVLSDALLKVPAAAWADVLPRTLTTVTMAAWYGWVMLVPYPVSPSQGRELVLTWRDPQFLLAVPGLLILIAATVMLVRHSRRAGFFACWFWLTLAPSVALTLMPGTLPIAADRFLYLPSVGGCALLVLGWRRLVGDFRDLRRPTTRRAPAIALAVITLGLAMLTLWRNEYWKDDLRLYYRMADTDPRSVIATLNLGLVHLNRSEPAEAGKLFDQARALAPDNSRVLVGYGLLRAETGHPDEGLALALEGLGHEPTEPGLHGLVARIYVIRGEFDKASAHYREAVRLQPHVPGHYFTLSFTLLKAGRVPPAVRAFEEGLERERHMHWHHPLIDRLGGELYATVDPARAITYWERYASALRATAKPTAETRAELATVGAELVKLQVPAR
jgi:tetratricopeptide (TPR) repeat protein